MQKSIRERDNHGYTMILVIAVMGLVTALCLSLLMSASMLLASARNAGQKEQCRILAISVSRAIREPTESFSYPSPPGAETDTSDISLRSKLQTSATAT